MSDTSHRWLPRADAVAAASMAMAGAGWSPEAIECLIESYRKHKVLYDVKDRMYYDKYARQNALQSVADSLAPLRVTTALEAKSKFTNLRTAFLVEKLKVDKAGVTEDGASPPGVYVPTLWYYDKMQFIADFIIPRRSKFIGYEEFEKLQNEDRASTSSFRDYDEVEIIVPDEQTSNSSFEVSPSKKVKVETLEVYDSLEQFGSFVVSRMRRIQNKEILLKLEHDIQLRIMDAECQDNSGYLS